MLPGVTRRDLLRVWTDLGRPYRIEYVAPDELRTARAVVSTSSISGVVIVDQVDDHPAHRTGRSWSSTWPS